MFTSLLNKIPRFAQHNSDGYDVADFRIGTLLGTAALSVFQIVNLINPEQIPNISWFVISQIIVQILTIYASFHITWVKRWANEIGNLFSFTYACSVLIDTSLDGFPIEESSVALLIVGGLSGMFKFKKALNLYTLGIVLFYISLILIEKPTEMSLSFALTVPLIFFGLSYYIFYIKLDFVERLRKNETKLKKNEAWFRNIFDNAPIGIVLFSQEFMAFKVNDFFQKLTGYTEGELLGNQIVNLVHPDDLVPVEAFKKRINDHNNIFEQRFMTKDGQLLWLRLEISPMCIDDEAFYIGMISDFSTEKQTKDQLAISNDALQRHNEVLQEFSYVVSHDLQEPLRMITSFSQIIQRRYVPQLDEAANRDFGFVIEGAKRMSTLIRDMLEYSRWTSRALPLQEVVVADCLKEALQNLTVAIQKSNAKIELGNLPTIVASRLVLTQLFQNLISNAIKYRQPNRQPHIQIRAEQQETEWLFTVQDHGIGFESQFKETIFGIFQRLHTDRTTGNGIGLAISKRIVERQSGRIWAESMVGTGSIFYFTMPLYDSSAIEITPVATKEKDIPEGFLMK